MKKTITLAEMIKLATSPGDSGIPESLGINRVVYLRHRLTNQKCEILPLKIADCEPDRIIIDIAD